MKLHLPDQVYDCLCCGKGCRMGWNIPVEADVEPGIRASQITAEVGRQGYQAIAEGVLGHRPDGSCVFLGQDSLCNLHREAGLYAKPLQCRQFPFLPVNTPDGVYIGLSFLCTAIQRNHGRACSEHRDHIEHLVGSLQNKLGGRAPAEMAAAQARVPVGPGAVVDWQGFLTIETLAQELLNSPDPLLGLWGLLARLLELLPRQPGQQSVRLTPTLDELQCSAGELPEAAEELAWIFVATLVGLAEAHPGPNRPAVSQAVMEDAPFQSQRLGHRLGPVPLESPWVSRATGLAGSPPWLVPELRRYLGHLLFRKYLFQGPSLVTQSLMLVVLVYLLDYYTRLSAAAHGRVPEHEDFCFALDAAEGEIVTHAAGLEGVLEHFQATLLSQR